MTILNDPVAMERRVRKLEMAVKRAKDLREQLKNLINQAEDVLKNHAGRISANETDIQTGANALTNHAGRISTNEGDIITGRDKLIDHEQRIAALENT